MKIIAGKHKGRNIKTSNKSDYRPTTGRTREALFSILTSGKFLTERGSILNDAIILDLYSGTGSLSLEALSRGAKLAIAVDIEQEYLNMLKDTAIKFGEEDNLIVLRADAEKLPKAKYSCDIVFMDPPYGKNFLATTLQSLYMQGWLKEHTIIIIELDRKERFKPMKHFNLIDQRFYGKTQIMIFSHHKQDL